MDSEGKGEKKILIDFEPYKPINASIYFCDTSFHTEQLSYLLENEAPFGFIVVDGSGALYATLSGSSKEIISKFTVDLPKKHGRGGQSAVRFERIRISKRHNYLRKVCETAEQCFLSSDKINV